MNLKQIKPEVLAPAGNAEKLQAALYFGADAVYFGGKGLNLRAYADNFEQDEIKSAIELCHKFGAKAYVVLNIFAQNKDFEGLKQYLEFLEQACADGVIVSDLGIAGFVREYSNLNLHISTQANITNKYAAKEWVRLGAKRLILARELMLNEIREIGEYIGGQSEIEAFVHGAMCVSYSGRCLLSNFLTERQANKGECVQACRWLFSPIRAQTTQGGGIENALEICDDLQGAYILNSKDLCLIRHLDKLVEAGVTSFKIEGRMKTSYYVANAVNAYRRAVDLLPSGKFDESLASEVLKASHRQFCEGFLFGREQANIELNHSSPTQEYTFIAVVLKESDEQSVLVQMRNCFKSSDCLQILAPHSAFNGEIIIDRLENEVGEVIENANRVQQSVRIFSRQLKDLQLKPNDILRKKII